MSYDAQFTKAVQIVKDLPPSGKVQPSQEQKLDFYSNFKQANEGDVNTSRPGMMDFVGKAKWDAWKKQEGTSKEDAKRTYIEHLRMMLKKSAEAGDDAAKKLLDELESAGPSA